MNVAEDVTMRWLISKDYFVMPSVKDGRRDADLLAVKLTGDGLAVAERLHVEVTVSSTPYCSYAEPESDAVDYFERKFTRIRKKVCNVLRGEPTCWVVIGKLSSRREWDELWERRIMQYGVRIVRFNQVVQEYLSTLTTRPTDDVGQLFHILHALNLLREPLVEWDSADGPLLKAVIQSLRSSPRAVYEFLLQEADDGFTLEQLAEKTGYSQRAVRRSLEAGTTVAMRHGKVPIHWQQPDGKVFITGKVAEVFRR